MFLRKQCKYQCGGIAVARRQALSDIRCANGSNPALVLDCYPDIREGDPDSKSRSLQDAMDSVRGLCELYQRVFDRWQSSLEGAKQAIVGTNHNRVLIGSGETVCETSLRLHGTYGFPLIPGSALKGLAASYAARVWGAYDEGFADTGAHYQCLFGTQNGQGLMVFHDAWIQPASLVDALLMDVLTVHYPSYYRDEAKIGASIESDDPQPISFISVRGDFLLAVSPVVSDEKAEPWAQLALDLLVEALQEWGVGAKTNAGYGRLSIKVREEEGQTQSPKATQVEYETGDIVTGIRVQERGRNARRRQRYELTGGYRGFVNSLEADVAVGESRQLRVVGCDKTQRSVTLEPLGEGGG